jgi:hypothetical protein
LSSFEPAPGPATRMSVFFDTEPATLAPRLSARAFASSRVNFSSEPVKTTVLPATGLPDVTGCSATSWRHLGQQARDHLDIARLLVELDDGARDDLADALDSVEIVPGFAGKRCRLLHRRFEGFIGAIGARQQLGGGLADMADAERVDEAVERDAAPLVDRRVKLADADLAEAVDILELGQREAAWRFSSVKMSGAVRICSDGSSLSKKKSICFEPSPSMS